MPDRFQEEHHNFKQLNSLTEAFLDLHTSP